MDLDQRCQAIELILSDVDGVLTDGRLIYDNQGIESKAFHIRDGQGIRLWHKTGRPFGLVTARNSRIVRTRAAELEIDILHQEVADKLVAVRQIADELGLKLDQICYLGDDLPDVQAIRQVGLGVAVADACEEAREAANHVTQLGAGKGAVRETIEMTLRAQGRWQEVIKDYVA